MRRFHWRLQRLLDVTVQREQALRTELLGLSRRIARLRQELLRRQHALRSLLAELSAEPPGERIARQQLFLRYCDPCRREIARLEQGLADLQDQRRRMIRRFLEVRASRQNLQHRREQARQRHLREELKLEQAQFDESAHVRFARTPQVRPAPAPRAGDDHGG